ncbi:MerR family transcriptional regulator [Streptomyces candidus]|uniref:DNA-binding transcriptional MerR regulator n=1 Tax=Streptomyces candidus TaxID=67283 RepID=A0A7X0LQZ9_9ACTN|nr:MerR family transcriptional regulator [Streptomyces candidus]MBB6438118.1 DNA-binding transcriptional MerR regulator [Streptomyces candidus]GHH39217.1 MerR family transcriptional regulator [Streptomyces candidus]
MRIGELGRRTGVHAHQLRYYEAQGLLEAERRANGYREYDESAVLRVKQIRHLLGAGLSSEDIAYVLPCAVGETPELPGCDELLSAMRSRLRRLDDQLAGIARSRSALLDYIDAAERVGGESYPPFAGADPAFTGPDLSDGTDRKNIPA